MKTYYQSVNVITLRFDNIKDNIVVFIEKSDSDLCLNASRH